jgi:hypothetical protein
MEDQCQYVPHPQPQAVVPGVGFVQGIMRYTVTDSLAVAPMSSSVALLSTFAALDLSAIQEKTVQLGHAEVLALHRHVFLSLLCLFLAELLTAMHCRVWKF